MYNILLAYTVFICQILHTICGIFDEACTCKCCPPLHPPLRTRFHFGISLLFPYLTRAPSHQIFRAVSLQLLRALHFYQSASTQPTDSAMEWERGEEGECQRMPIKNLNQFSIWISHNCKCISVYLHSPVYPPVSASVAFS